MQPSAAGVLPHFPPGCRLPSLAWDACPGKGLNYPLLYREHYGSLPSQWLLGCFQKVRIAYAAEPEIRRAGASGGVISRVLIRLLEDGRVDAAAVVRQGIPAPREARAQLVTSKEEVLACAQSVYIPVSTLDILRCIPDGMRVAMTCLPDQAAALRRMQCDGFEPARRVTVVLGPYTGTALEPGAIDCFLHARGVRSDDPVTSLQWRAGEWPGYLEIHTASGRCLKAKKFYYNYLIPFFVTQSSLQSMDFTNEFSDLSVGDAWSPRFEEKGEGFSVVTTRTVEMEDLVSTMCDDAELVAEDVDAEQSLSMHGHMLDFKKRGGYIRNRVRRSVGLKAPDYGWRPSPLPLSRWVVELVIIALFGLCRTRVARWLVRQFPERMVGVAFDVLRKGWKSMSKPAKRRGLSRLTMICTESENATGI